MLNNENESLGPLTKESKKSLDQKKIFFLLCCFGLKLNSDLSVEKLLSSLFSLLKSGEALFKPMKESNPLLPQPLSSKKENGTSHGLLVTVGWLFQSEGHPSDLRLETKLTLLACEVHSPMQPYH